MNRYRQIEHLQSEARAAIPAAALATFEPIRAELETLTKAATSATSDAALLHKIAELHDRASSILPKLDPAPMARAIEQASVQALIAGVLAMQKKLKS